MVCHQTGKTQACIGRLLEHLMGATSYGYFKFTAASPKCRVEYFDSSLNYLTVYLEEEQRFRDASKAAVGVEEGVYDQSNNTLCKLFQVQPEQGTLFLAEGMGQEKLLFRIKLSDDVLFEVLKASPDMRRTFCMFAETVIEALHRSKFETSK